MSIRPAHRAAGPFAAAAIATLFIQPAIAEDDIPLGSPYIVNGGANVLLEDQGVPYVSEGVSVGNVPHMSVLSPDSGGLWVDSFVEWHNNGLFYVGSHFGAQSASGTVTFAAGSTFYNYSPGFPEDIHELPADVRIGQGGSGFVAVLEGATWHNEGQPNQVNFTVAEQGELSIEGALYSNALASIQGGRAVVHGANALWEVGNSLDIEGYSKAGELQVANGGRVYDIGSLNIAFSDGSSAVVHVGDGVVEPPADGETPLRSLLQASFIGIGVYGTANGQLSVTGNGRVETMNLTLGSGGGTGLLDVDAGGEVLVGGFYGGGPFTDRVELRNGSTIDVSDGGKVVIGSNTPPLLEPVFGVIDFFGEIDPGTVLVSRNGKIKGTGTINGKLIIADGSLIPGHSTGTLTVDGDLELRDDAIVEIEIASGSDYDRIVVTGELIFGGTLHLAFVDGFAPTLGDLFILDIFEAGAQSGGFAGVTTTGLAEGLKVLLDLDGLAAGAPLTFSVVPVPLPAAGWLFMSSLGLLAAARRRRPLGEARAA